MPLNFDNARFNMVEQQVRPWEVLDRRVLDTLMAIQREDFVQPQHRKLAFADMALPLEHGEHMFKPVVEGRILQALDLDPSADVLEIGTGSGYLTACLARLARAVTSIDRHADFVERAQHRVTAAGFSSVRFETADLFEFEPGRSFDAVVLGGAVMDVPPRVLEWVRPGGRLFAIRGAAPAQEAVLIGVYGEANSTESLFETDVPYLDGAGPVPRFIL